MNINDVIEKAKVSRKVGDSHPSKPWVWTEYKPGKFDWRPAKNSAAKGSSDSGGSDSSDDGSSAKKTPSKPSAQQIANAKTSGAGKTPMTSAQLTVWAQKTDESVLVKCVNNQNMKANVRLIAYNELKERGYDIDSLDTSGNLSQILKMSGKISSNPPTPTTDDDDLDDNGDEGDDDGDVVTEKWYLNKNDSRVKKMFNFKTKDGRIKYDQWLDKQKRKEPDYEKPVEVIQNLNEQYLEFIDNPEQRFMISAGGAGVGKTYGFKKLAELLSMKPFSEGDSAGDGDYDYFEAPDINSGKQLLNVLKAHNGKIILFDDNDKVLTRADCSSVMKKATATTGARIVGDPDDVKTNFEFTGRIVIMTNKDLATLSESEDTKAIISRSMMTSEIYLTVPETLEIIEQRYMDYEFKQAPRLDDPSEDEKERKEVFDLIKKNIKNIDPATFSTRTYQEVLVNKRKVDNANEKRSSAAFASLIGSKMKDWRTIATSIITKADEYFAFNYNTDDIIKGDAYDDGVDYTIDDPEEDITKAIVNEFMNDDMSIEKAEELLLN